MNRAGIAALVAISSATHGPVYDVIDQERQRQGAMMLIDNWKTVVFERYALFEGRARRAEFWWFWLANVIVLVVLAVLASSISNVFWLVYVAYGLAMIVPSIAVGVRRLHDTGKSGWLLLIGLIPFGGLVLLVFYLLDSTPGANQYGVSPKYPNG